MLLQAVFGASTTLVLAHLLPPNTQTPTFPSVHALPQLADLADLPAFAAIFETLDLEPRFDFLLWSGRRNAPVRPRSFPSLQPMWHDPAGSSWSSIPAPGHHRMMTRHLQRATPGTLLRELRLHRHRLCWLALAFGSVAGCTDGPFFHLKKLNPYIQNQWREDREKVVVPSQRVEEIRLLRNQIASMSSDEQAKWIANLDSILKEESSPEIRREAVLALQGVNSRPDALEALAGRAKDNSDYVRLAVVDVLHKSPSEAAGNALLSMAAADPSSNVRLQATEALGAHRSDEVKQFLASKLEDRNPAMQYHVSIALKEFTGKNYGGDMEAWRSYLAGEEVPEPKASLAETLQSLVPLKR